jgi:catechol 2,3-dioxygenase-like lactoylglutathione lyase family enzyme
MTTAFPTDGVEATLLLVVADIERSRDWYRDVLGATLYREYGGTSPCEIFRLSTTAR